MSIIHDALKKTQTALGNNPAPTNGSSERGPTPPSEPKSSQSVGWIVLAFVSVVLIIVGFFSSTLLNLFQQSSQSAMKTNMASAPSMSPAASAGLSKTKNNAPVEPLLNLQGTMYMDGSYSALINDNIYKAGETIDGIKILGITLEQVELDKNGEIITMNVRNKRKL